MLNKKTNISHSTLYETSVDMIEINNTFSLFESILTVTKNGKQEKTVTSSGIQKTYNILRCIESGEEIKHLDLFLLKNEKILNFLRVYGFPYYSSEYETYLNPLTEKEECPVFVFKEIHDEQDLSMQTFIDNPELLNDLIYFDYSYNTTIELLSGKLVNSSVHVDKLLIGSSYLKNLENTVEHLISEKRLLGNKNKREVITFVPGNGYCCFGRVIFTDEEFQRIAEAVKKDDNNSLGSFAEVGEFVFKEDLIGISDHYHGFDCEPKNIYVTRHDIEDEEDDTHLPM